MSGHFLIVQPWTHSFKASIKKILRVIVWMRLLDLPLYFYHPKVLRIMGNLIGRIVKIDFNTQNSKGGKFTRVAVDIDLNAPLKNSKAHVKIDGDSQKIEFESLPNVCYSYR